MLILRARKSLTGHLARRFPDRFAVAHARAVQRVVSRHTGRGRPQSALQEVETALSTLRQAGDSDRHRFAYALLLSIQAARLLDATRLEAATTVVDRAISIYQQLPDTSKVRAEMAYARGSRALILVSAGRLAEGLSEAERAAGQLRDRPQRTQYQQRQLVLALRTVAVALDRLGPPDRAVAAWREAVAAAGELSLYHRLAWPTTVELPIRLARALQAAGDLPAALAEARRAELRAGGLTSSMTRHLRSRYAELQLVRAQCAGALGHHREAGFAARTAAEEFRPFAEQNPSVFAPSLALALECQSRAREAVDHPDPVTPAREAVAVSTRLATTDPAQFAIRRAESLSGLSDRLWHAEQRKEALDVAEQAFTAYCEVPAPQRSGDVDVATVRVGHACATRLSEGDRPEQAFDVGLATLERARRLAATTGRNQELLYQCLHWVGYRRHERHEHAQAREIAEEMLAVAQGLPRDEPAAFPDRVVESLHLLGQAMLALGRPDEAVQRYTEALAVVSDLVDDSERGREEVAFVRNELGTALRHAGRFRDAVDAATITIDMWEALTERDASFGEHYARAIMVRVLARQALDQHSEAIDDLDAAIAVRHRNPEPDGPGERMLWSLMAQRARAAVLAGREREAVVGIQALRQLAAGSTDPAAQGLVDGTLPGIHKAAPERLEAAWEQATGEAWPWSQ